MRGTKDSRASLGDGRLIQPPQKALVGPRVGSPRRGASFFGAWGGAKRTMKLTVTSGAGVTEVVDRHASARAAPEQVLALLGRKQNDVRIFDEDGRRRSPADLCR